MHVRQLDIDDADAFHALRLHGLESDPDPFLTTRAEDGALSREAVHARFPRGGDNFALGAFDEAGALVGIVGFARETREKIRHRGNVWGMFVASSVRGQGVARALMEQLVERCRAIDGLEQLVLEVNTTATSARRLYASMGFESIGTHRESMKVGDRYLETQYMVLWLKN